MVFLVKIDNKVHIVGGYDVSLSNTCLNYKYVTIVSNFTVK